MRHSQYQPVSYKHKTKYGQNSAIQTNLGQNDMTDTDNINVSQSQQLNNTNITNREQYMSSAYITPKLAQKYNVIRELGKGAYGTVYLAEEKRNVANSVANRVANSRTPNNRFAIKVVQLFDQVYPEYGIKSSLVIENSLLTRLNHPNIIKVYEIDTDSRGKTGLVLELAETDLAQLIDYEWFKPENLLNNKDTQIPIQLQIAYDIFCGVHYLHQNGIIYLDLKPPNILIQNNHAKIADFGLSNRFYSYRNLDSYRVTYQYRAPEIQCGLEYDKNSDIWSIGAILTELFFNVQIFGASEEYNLYSHIEYKLGAPSQNWRKKYVNFSSKCPSNVNRKAQIWERALFKHQEDQAEFFRNDYYGPTLYYQLLDLISKCLRYNPEERIQFADVVNHPVFQNTLCNCTYCQQVTQYTLNLGLATALNPTIEDVIPSSYSQYVVPYGREIYRRYRIRKPMIGQGMSIDDMQIQAVALNLACKYLDFPQEEIEQLRQEFMELTNILSVNQFNKLELEVASTINWNFDGPF